MKIVTSLLYDYYKNMEGAMDNVLPIKQTPF